jgi:hypothetical protein
MTALCDSPLTDVDSATRDLLPCQQIDVSLALKINPTSNSVLHPLSIMHQRPAIILNGKFKGLEVTLCQRVGERVIDDLDGTVAPLLKVSGFLVQGSMHSQDKIYFFADKAEDLLDSMLEAEQIRKINY